MFVDPTHEMDKYYRAADLFVLSSVREANPVALLEAMSCGLPCIASRLDGSTDVIIEDGVNGRLVAPDDEQALAAALAGVLADPGAGRRMGMLARETIVSRYDIRETAERWLDAYRTVLGQPSVRVRLEPDVRRPPKADVTAVVVQALRPASIETRP